ncbi:NADH:flavin oxidoreductase/NADH oxidase [Salinimicrobium sediminilitoris]|uniref:NADH:flavin oxidoreductase/NADH oxidase n=1 Tax=Salinimicrobium sediminilitoris TaxID=2876715 RepID=UPI001E370E7E|nr:NADH:flavin oxidoreductase/NADH oxidase [Salinimicrobium sediminilitoris]MCC8358890.1 NADH:flavin oxidoreductase/NADH oxidase [Salinimicrobium sediminilitoris]
MSPRLFEPLKIKSIQIKNRIGVSPMCMYSSKDGFANNWHLVHLGTRATGGAGLVISEAAAVSPEARITPDDLGIWKDAHVEKLKEIIAFLEGQGSVPGIQLAHAGRKASTTNPWKGGKFLFEEEGGWQPVAPSAIPFYEENPAPKELDSAGIEKVIFDFREASKRALSAGFKVVEIHAAHGYLLHEFLSPLSNHRKDEYGGSFENRSRLLLEVTRAVREVWPENLPLFVRISATDWAAGGWNDKESVELAKLLKVEGVDLIDCSSGGLVPNVSIPVQKKYQVPFSEKLKSEADILTAAVGLITTPREAEEVLEKEQADIILLGREMLRNPYFPLEAAAELDAAVDWPNQYLRAKQK